MSIFNSIPAPKVKRSRFNLSHTYKTACSIGKLVPTLVREVIPGDVWNVSSNSLVRLAPTVAPLMHNMQIRTETFFVPNRLLWKDWKDFITGGQDGTLLPVKPRLAITGLQNIDYRNTIVDYLGLPLDPITGYLRVFNSVVPYIDIMPFLALALVYNEYYRDPNLDPDWSNNFPVSSGNFTPSSPMLAGDLFKLQSRCWSKDYFTSALPFVQRGPAAAMPITGQVTLNNSSTSPMLVKDATNGSTRPTLLNGLGVGNAGALVDGSPTGNNDVIDPNGRLSATSSVTINDLRRTSAVQKWLENNARGGARYIEQILSHFGVVSSDSRLQRPEFLGSGRAPVYISEILQTSGSNITGQSTPQGNMSGHGIGGGQNRHALRIFEEHGFIVSFMSIVPQASYIFGLETMWTRFDKLDYPWPELARLGERAVLRRELDASVAGGNDPFGFQPQYSDFKNILSRTTGEMSRTLSFWQAARRLNNVGPVLSSDFVHIQDSLFDQNFAAGANARNQQVYVEIAYNITCSRLLPKYGVPILS